MCRPSKDALATKYELEVRVSSYTVIDNVTQAIEIPQDGTLSRTIHKDEHVKVVLFGFAAGQELSQHTASVPAMVQIVNGEVRFTLDGDEKELSAGAWLYMQANVPHAVYAKSNTVMLLTMMTGAQK
jgi:quercetin dioxygenase-like cupin family protein